jgi:hypothetical protein
MQNTVSILGMARRRNCCTERRVLCSTPVVPKVGGGITEVGANRYER